MARKIGMMVLSAAFGFALAVFLFTVGCEAPAPTTGETSGQGETSAQGGTVLAKVGTTVITLEEFNASLENVPPYFRQRLATREGKQQQLDNMIVKELFYQEALNKGYDKDSEYLKELEEVKKTILFNRVRNDFVKLDFTPSEDEKKAYYDEHPDEFTIPERATVRHIRVKLNPNATDDEVAQAQAKIEQAQADLKKGTPFEQVAEKYSDERGSASKGGLLSPIKKGSRGKEFDDAVFALKKPGERSPVFKDARGFHIVQLEKLEPAELRPYDQVEKTIERKIINERRRSEYDKFVEDLKSRIGVTINEDLLTDEIPAAPETPEVSEEEAGTGERELTPVTIKKPDQPEEESEE